MIDWSLGSWTGSINKWVNREVWQHLRNNPVAKRSRYGRLHRALRFFFSVDHFVYFISYYAAINLLFVAAEAAASEFWPAWLPAWTAPGPSPDLKSLLLNVSSYLIGAQVGVLGVISLALALVTLIAQNESSATDVKVYYHQSLAFEVVASCVALLAVLCAQLLWPAQFLLHRFGFGTELLFFKFGLLALHLLWLLLNLASLALFIAITFGFVQQTSREALRERYTANVIQPYEMTQRLRQFLYSMGAEVLGGKLNDSDRPSATFGIELGSPREIEIESEFEQATALYDVRMIWVKWALSRWARRCAVAASSEPAPQLGGLNLQEPLIWFTPRLDVSLTGRIGWCRRRGGVPLDRFEKFVLRRAFRFRRSRREE
jgi:hypothetical protein